MQIYVFVMETGNATCQYLPVSVFFSFVVFAVMMQRWKSVLTDTVKAALE